MRKMTMPVKKYKEESVSSSKGSGYSNLFRPLPDKAGEKYDNNIFVSLMSPDRWKVFSPDQQMLQKYSMNPSFQLKDPEGAALNTFFMPLPMHWVKNASRSDGSVGGSHVLCPQKMNDQLKTLLNNDVLFLEDRCAYCEKEAEYWKIFNEAWAESGFDKDSFKGNTQGYMDFVNNNPVMSKAREAAFGYKARDRYIVSVFDLNKFWGTRPLDEGEETPSFQIWFSPKQIFDNLYDLHETYAENDLPSFYDITQEGVLPIVVTRDTTKCSGSDLRRTKYSVTASPIRKPIDDNWKAYLDNPDSMPDPTELFGIMTYEEMFAALGENVEEEVVARKHSMPSMPPAQRTPQTPSAPTPPAPPQQAPVAPPTPPEAPSQSTPPSPPTPPAAPPVAPPTASNPTPPVPAVRDEEDLPDFVPGVGGDEW